MVPVAGSTSGLIQIETVNAVPDAGTAAPERYCVAPSKEAAPGATAENAAVSGSHSWTRPGMSAGIVTTGSLHAVHVEGPFQDDAVGVEALGQRLAPQAVGAAPPLQ